MHVLLANKAADLFIKMTSKRIMIHHARLYIVYDAQYYTNWVNDNKNLT